MGDTLVPLIFMSDGTHLSNFSGKMKEWPVYRTITHLSSKIRQMPSTQSVLMVTLLPIPLTNCNIPQKRLNEQQQTNREVLNEVLRYSRLASLNTIPALGAVITTFSMEMATSGVPIQFQVHGLQIAQSIATYIISSSMSVFGASVQRTNLEILSVLRCNTPGGITTYIECLGMPTPRQPMPKSSHAMLMENSTCFDIFSVSSAISPGPTSS